MVWTVIFSNKTAVEILTSQNDYEEAFQKAQALCGESSIFAILKGSHKITVRFF